MEIINIVVTFYDLLKFQDRRRKKFVFMIDETELSVPFVAGAGKNADFFVSQIPLQKTQRNYCQAAVDLYGVENGVWSSFFKGSPDMKAMPADKGFEKFSCAASCFPHDETLII